MGIKDTTGYVRDGFVFTVACVEQGDGAMQRLAKSNVLVCGAGGIGVEIGM